VIKTRSNIVFLLHGKGGSPEGSVKQLQVALATHWPALQYFRPLLSHHDPAVLAEESVEALRSMEVPLGTMVIGVSLGGLVAAKLQEAHRPDLQVICINSPNWADGVRLDKRSPNRVAFYSSHDEVIAGRTENWPKLAESYDLPWLTHDTDAHVPRLVRLILACRNGENIREVVANLGLQEGA
jgi:pimeloyl-ACP methyl ester carboxylesterase